MVLMTKFLVITEIGYSKRDYSRFGLAVLEKHFEIYILNLTGLSYPNYVKNHKEKVYKTKNYIEIKNLNEVLKIIEDLKPSFVFDCMTNSLNSLYIRKFLNLKKIKLISLQAGLVPKVNRTFYEKIYRFFLLIFQPLFFFRKIRNIFSNIFIFKQRQNFSDIFIITGRKGEDKSLYKSKLIFSHSLDYENYLNFEKSINLKKKLKKNIVFLDQYLPFHPGAIMRKEKPKATKEKYFTSINNFFTFIENKISKKICVACHPRADYNLHNPFDGRELVYNDTINLVKNCEFVLAHTSTSISYAVIYKKPIIFLTSNEIINSYDDFRIHSMSRELNSVLVNIDNINDFNKNIELDKLFRIDENKYQKFQDNYIKHPNSSGNSIWFELINVLKSYNLV